jgi:predicted nucleotidyltransferase
MRQIIYARSARAIYLDRKSLIGTLKSICQEAVVRFPEIKKIVLFGSLSKQEETGLSDVDIFLLIDNDEKNPIERAKPYFFFFSGKLDIGIDVLTATDDELENFKDILQGGIVLYEREKTANCNASR